MEKKILSDSVTAALEEQPKPVDIVKHPSWTEEDETVWLKTIPMHLHATARRHGKACFQLAMQGGVIGFATQQILAASGGQAQQLCQMIVQAADAMCKRALRLEGLTVPDFQACQKDIEIVGQLVSAMPGEGKIVIAH